MVNIVYANEKYFKSFHKALTEVAHERIYVEMIEPPPLDNVAAYQQGLIQAGGASYYAINENDEVVGWADIFPDDNPRLKHRGSLGMGVIKKYRGQKVGERLLKACLLKAKEAGLEKVELNVYASNTIAHKLYKKLGFQEEGYIKHYRKLDGKYFDCILMGLFL